MDSHEALMSQMKATADTVRAYAQQIESGEYGDTWTVTYIGQNDSGQTEWENVPAAGDYEAIEAIVSGYGAGGTAPSDDFSDYSAELNTADEPTHDETPISEYPLEIVDERGKEFAVVLTTGGPHIEVVADGLSSARLEGYWAGDRATLYGDYLSTFLDYFIDRESE